jgi:hypothetical protein
MKASIFIFLFYFYFGKSVAQEDINSSYLLEKQKQVLVEKFPGYFEKDKIIDIKQINSDHSRIDYIRKGDYCEAFVNSKGDDMLLIETDQLIPNYKIPAVIKYNVAQNYKSWKIDKSFLVTTPSSGILYRIDICKNEKIKKVKKLYYSDSGAYRNEPPK